MKTIVNIEDDVLFLQTMYKSAEAVKKLVEVTGLAEIRKHMPKYELEDTVEEKAEKMRKQGIENTMEMFRQLTEEHPAETIAVLHSFIILDKGEKYPKGFELMSVAFEIFSDARVQSFLSSMMPMM